MSRSWKIISVFALLMSAVVPACLSVAQDEQGDIDWPMFQYNMQRTGACDYPAIEQPEIAWSTRVGIMGYLNNPVIDGDRVFVGSSGSEHNTPDDLDGIYCLDLNTGEILWHRPTDTDACGVAISETLVFAGDDGGLFQAIDRESGEVVWTLKSITRNGLVDQDGEMIAEFEDERAGVSVFAQPLLVGNLVIVGDSNGLVYAVEQNTGEVEWLTLQQAEESYGRNDAIRGGLSSDGDTIYGVGVSGFAYALSLDGETLWDWEDSAYSSQFYGAPTIAAGRVILAAADYSWHYPGMLSLDVGTGELNWDNSQKPRHERGDYNYIRTSPALFDGVLFYGESCSRRLIGVDAETGDPIWHDEIGVAAYVQWASPVIAGEVMYLARPDGALYAIYASDREVAWSVYLGDNDLHGLETPDAVSFHRDGWDKPPVGDALYATPAIARDGTVVTGSGDGWLYCIRERD